MKQKLLLAFAALLVALAIGELAARVALRRHDSSAWYREHLSAARWGGGNWLSELVPHPYFGFVLASDREHANNYGFQDPRPFPHVKKHPKELVIAVLGGSVAHMWAQWIQGEGHAEFVATLKKHAPAYAGREIVVLNMAMGGFKQPQQLHVASYFAPGVDLFLNVEGHNELEASSHLPLFPIEYPIGAYLQYQRTQKAAGAARRLRFLGSLGHALVAAGHEHRALGASGLYFALTKSVFAWTADASRAAALEAKEALRQELSDPRRSFRLEAPTDPLAGPAAAVAAWERFVLQQHHMLGATKARAVFFLQPNQYLPGSKPFSEWEREHAFMADSLRNLRKAKEYQLLPPAAERLRRQGVPIHDLTPIFRDTQETVYADDCCHLNDAGHRIMSTEIARRLGGRAR